MFNEQVLTEEIVSLRKFALRLTKGNIPDAEDLLQSTVTRALEKEHLFRPDSHLFRWMSKIMFNLFVSQYRRSRKFETQYDPDDFIQKESVESDQEDHVTLNEVARAMDKLSPEHRNIIVLACVEGMPYQEVSRKLNIPTGTVRSRLSRARQQLRAVLDMPEASAESMAA